MSFWILLALSYIWLVAVSAAIETEKTSLCVSVICKMFFRVVFIYIYDH
jgi:hypothetical protein